MLESLTLQEVTLLVLGILLLISLITGAISYYLETDRSRQWFGDWFQGVSTEMIGAVVTTLFFTFIVGAVEQQQQRAQRLEDLISQMGSTVNSEAVRAVEELRAEGWLRDGTLREHEFYSANLSRAQMPGADLADAILFDAELEETNLQGANLSGVNFQSANLRNADLRDADLRGATLSFADLGGADLTNADLRGALLPEANLEGANLTNVRFDETTALPDAVFGGENYTPNWTSDTDMTRFTNPDHPDFWRPEESEFGYPEWYTPPD